MDQIASRIITISPQTPVRDSTNFLFRACDDLPRKPLLIPRKDPKTGGEYSFPLPAAPGKKEVL